VGYRRQQGKWCSIQQCPWLTCLEYVLVVGYRRQKGQWFSIQQCPWLNCLAYVLAVDHPSHFYQACANEF
jgi:hypothetical protein